MKTIAYWLGLSSSSIRPNKVLPKVPQGHKRATRLILTDVLGCEYT